MGDRDGSASREAEDVEVMVSPLGRDMANGGDGSGAVESRWESDSRTSVWEAAESASGFVLMCGCRVNGVNAEQ